MEVPAGGAGSAGKAPPTVTFRWGAFESFKAVPTRLDVQFVLFRADGEPVRAWTRMNLLQVAPDPRSGSGTPAAQNPTTRAAEAGSSCIVCEGDSLPSLAYQAYGDPTALAGDRARQRHPRPAAAAPRPPPDDPGAEREPVKATDLAAGCQASTLGGSPLDPALAAPAHRPARRDDDRAARRLHAALRRGRSRRHRRAEDHRRRDVQARRAAQRQARGAGRHRRPAAGLRRRDHDRRGRARQPPRRRARARAHRHRPRQVAPHAPQHDDAHAAPGHRQRRRAQDRRRERP